MSRWDNEGVAYKRTQNWTALPHGDEFISVVNNFGPMIVKLNYYDEVLEGQQRKGGIQRSWVFPHRRIRGNRWTYEKHDETTPKTV